MAQCSCITGRMLFDSLTCVYENDYPLQQIPCHSLEQTAYMRLVPATVLSFSVKSFSDAAVSLSLSPIDTK